MIQNYFQELLQRLFLSPVISSFRILRKKVQEEDGYIRIKCRLQGAQKLEFAEYVQVHSGKIVVITYNYHWQDANGTLVKRWDNVPHHKEIDSFPHHVHLSENEVMRSQPMAFENVLRDIEDALATQCC